MTSTPRYANRCGAKTPAGTCNLPSGHGTPYAEGRCSLHGGLSPGSLRGRHRDVVQREAARFAVDLERNENPADVLLSELVRSRARAAYWEERLQTGDLPVTGRGIGGSTTLSVEAELWQRETDRAVGIASKCVSLGLEARRVAQAERVGKLLADACVALVRALDVDPGSERGQQAFRAGLSVFEAGGAVFDGGT